MSQIIYLGHIPYGFYEEQMFRYFSQFGKLIKIRLSCNKLTGNSKHYAFLEFEHPIVAKIAAETMNNYLMFKQRLVCRIVPVAKHSLRLFNGVSRKFCRENCEENMKYKKNKGCVSKKATLNCLVRRQKARKRRIRANGIEYD